MCVIPLGAQAPAVRVVMSDTTVAAAPRARHLEPKLTWKTYLLAVGPFAPESVLHGGSACILELYLRTVVNVAGVEWLRGCSERGRFRFGSEA